MKKARAVLIVSLTILALAAGVSAQSWRGMARLQGTVIDKTTGKPVQGAIVTLKSIRAGEAGPPPMTTNAKGKWAALGLLGGEWYVDVAAAGYLLLQKSVSLSEVERMPPMKLEIEPVPPPPPPQPEEAKEVVQIGGATVPPEAIAAVEAGNAFMQEKKYKEAIVEYEKVLSLVPDLAPVKRTLAMAYHYAGMTSQAVSLLKELNELDPTFLIDAYALASFYLQQEKLDQAKGVLDKVPDTAFTDPTLLVDVGKHFYNANRGQQAYDYFAKAVTVDSNRGESYYYRGLASLILNKAAGAKADFQKVIELAPDSSEANDAREMLKSLK